MEATQEIEPVTRSNDPKDHVEYLKSVTRRLQQAKEALEIEGTCPEAALTHEEDPYNLGFLWASLSNSLHSASDALNGILVYIEPGGLKEALENSEMVENLHPETPETLSEKAAEIIQSGEHPDTPERNPEDDDLR